MKRLSLALLCVGLVTNLVGQAPPPKTPLKVGDMAPDFELGSTKAEFAKKLSVDKFAMLSDFAQRKVTAAYGVLMPDRGIANRATFVVDKAGKITYIEEGSTAVDITSTADACSRLAHKN
jgi:peroxiredoxin